MNEGKIAIVSNELDVHVDAVIPYLNQLEQDVVRVNTEHLNSKVKFSCHFLDGNQEMCIEVLSTGQKPNTEA